MEANLSIHTPAPGKPAPGVSPCWAVFGPKVRTARAQKKNSAQEMLNFV